MDNTNSYTDNRGTIKDLIVTDDYSITHITFTEDAVRGNHYHEHTTQKDIILKGELICAVNEDKNVVTVGDYVQIEPNVRHAYKALKDSEILSICWGVRKGSEYEKDVIRLEGDDKLL